MKNLLTSLSIFCFLLFIASPILAQATPPQMQPGNAQINLGNKQPAGMGIKAISNPNATVGNIVSNVLLILFIIGGLAVLIFIIWGAFDWITSGGDKEKVAGARRKIVNALIGLAILAFASFIVTLAGSIVGYNPLSPTAKPLPKLDQPLAP